ncbi:Protein of uncharacterised function (DUF2002) [Pluralibacter gergoviae]|nr:Protein of uncharacterised function (DUF2002) [Pluralibacter gergoviae]
MYLRPDEVARVLEKAGFTVDEVTQKTYGYRRGENYVYVNREARMGRTALIIHPALKERSYMLAEPASDIKTQRSLSAIPALFGGAMRKSTTVFLTALAHAWRWSVFCTGFLAKTNKPSAGVRPPVDTFSVKHINKLPFVLPG